jgi:hypothetical protein
MNSLTLTLPVGAILVALFLPQIEYIASKFLYGKQKNINSLSSADRNFLKNNRSRYKKIENYSAAILMLAGFLLLFNYYRLYITLPNILLPQPYTGAKIFIVAVISIAYWSYLISRVASLLVFGREKGILVTEYEYVPGVSESESKIIHHPYQKLFGKKVVAVLVITLLILFV